MSWNAVGQNLSMAEGDFGIALPVNISGVTLGSQDSLKFTFKTAVNGEEVCSKEFDGIVDNAVSLKFTKEESNLFPVGSYVYRLDWYRNGDFMDNIIPCANFRVVDKA